MLRLTGTHGGISLVMNDPSPLGNTTLAYL
jgi:hypothetical protein